MPAAQLLLFIAAILGLARCQLKPTDCMDDLWAEGKLTPDMITVSSHSADKAQLKYDGQGWCGDKIAKENWVEIDFAEPTIIHEIHITNNRTAGTPRNVEWLTVFDKHTGWNKLAPTFDTQLNVNSKSIMNAGGSNFIKMRLNILSFDKHPCIKLQLFGCSPKEVCPDCQNGGQCLQNAVCRCPYGFVGNHCETETSKPPPNLCTDRQGLGDKSLTSDNLRVSSTAPHQTKEMGRLNYCCRGDTFGAWCPDPSDAKPWYEVTFPSPIAFGGLEIQQPSTPGVLTPPSKYMKTYRLEIVLSEDSLKQWRVVAPSLDAISNATISKAFLFVNPYVAIDALRIYPLTNQGESCFRFDVLGCDPSKLCTTGFCMNGGTCIGQNECSCAQGFYGADCSVTTLMTTVFEITSIVNQIIKTTTTLTFRIHGQVTLTSTSLGQAMHVTGVNSYVSVDKATFPSCLRDLRSCSSGFTINLNVMFNKLEENTYIISNGGDRPDGIGLALYYANKQIHYVVSTATMIWTLQTTTNIALNVWQHLEISWSTSLGIELFKNGQLIGSTTRPQPRPAPTKIVARDMTLGFGYTSTSTEVSLTFNGLKTYDAKRTDLVNQGVITVPPPTSSTKATEATSTSSVKPSTSSIAPTTKASPSVTTKAPIHSLDFTFLEIKNNILITPLHNFTVYGTPSIVPEVNGSAVLVLNKTGQYVELPNTGLQCLQDLTSCDNGFTLNVEIKFLNSTITDKQYIFSSGGDMVGTSGIALYLWKMELYCAVKWNKIIWTSKSKIHFNHTEWHTYQVSWNEADGFIVYVDGHLFMNHTIRLPNPNQPDVHSLLIAKGHGSTSTTFLDIRNLFAWTASRDVLIHQHIIQEYTTVKATTVSTTSTKTTPTITKAPPTTPTTKAPTTTPTTKAPTTTPTTKAPTTTPTTKTPTTTPTTKVPTTTPTTKAPATTPTTKAPTTKPSIVTYNWSFTKVNQTTLVTSDNITLQVYGGATVDPHVGGLHITQTTHYIDFGGHTNMCLGNLERCQSGITFEVEVEFKHLYENTILLSSGGERPDGTGIALIYRFGQIQCVVSTTTVSWYASVPRDKLTLSSFNSIVVSWSADKGLILYVDKQIVDFSTTQISHEVATNTNQHLYIGQPPSVTTSTQVDFYLKSIKCWQVWIDIIIDIDIIIGFPPSKVTTTSKPVTTRATTLTTKKATTTDVCQKGWICKDDITTPKPTTPKPTTPKPTTLPTTTTPKPTTAKPTPKPTTKPSTTPEPTTPPTTTPRPTKPGLPIYNVRPNLRPGVDGQGAAFFTCSFEKSFQENVEFIVCLNINGNCELMNIVSGTTDNYKFTVASINDNLHNKKITCSIQARFKGQSGLTVKLTSVVFTPTIKLVTSGKLVLTEGKAPQYVTVNSTAPPQMFCCPGCKGKCTVLIQTHTDYDRHDKKCRQWVLPQVVIGWKGTSQSEHAESCGASLSQSNWQGLIQIPIIAMVDNLYDRDHSTHVTVQAHVTFPRQPPIVTSTSLTLNIGRLDVVAKDNDHRAICTSLNDPHITTFDGRRYDNFNTGEFVLYRHKTLPYEVRAQYQKCSSRHARKNPSCNCAVAIKSGDDVITFSSCGSHGVTSHHDRHHHHPAPTAITIQMYKNGNLTPGTIIRRLGCGQKYEVHLPTGTVITIQSSARPFLNIWVKPSSLDYSQTEGLCGVYDRNRNNDVLYNSGRPYPSNVREPNEFSMKWHVSSGASIFTGVPSATVPGITRFCSCVQGRPVFCVNSHGTMRCLETRYDITHTVVSQARLPQLGGRGRSKRQASPNTPEVLPAITQNYTLIEAKEVCSSAIYNASVTEQCDSVVNGSDITERIDNCAADLETTGDDVWALDSIKDILEECLGEVEKTPVNVTSNSSVPVIDTSSLCSEKCLNGNCSQGICQCEPGFAGTDCSVSAQNTTPTVNPRPADDTGCDIRHASDKCQTVTILGQNFVESPTLTCHFTYIKVTSSVQRIGLETTVPANFTNMYQVSCRLPDANTGAFVKVSNNGISTSSEQYLHLVYDSVCFDCSIANDTTASTCTRKGDSCVIDEACYAKDETKPGEKFQVCKPDVSTSSWTDTCNLDPACAPRVEASTQDDTVDQTDITILGVVCGVLGLCLLVALGYILKNRSKKPNYKQYKVQEEKTDSVPEVAYDNKMYADNNYRL